MRRCGLLVHAHLDAVVEKPVKDAHCVLERHGRVELSQEPRHRRQRQLQVFVLQMLPQHRHVLGNQALKHPLVDDGADLAMPDRVAPRLGSQRFSIMPMELWPRATPRPRRRHAARTMLVE